MDTEFNDFASAMTLALTLNGQNSPTANIPMAGFRLTNVGAAASAEDYVRSKEYIKDVPIYVLEKGDLNHVQVSVAYYVSVSAGQSPPDGARLRVRMGATNGTKASTTCTFYLYTPLNTSVGGAPHVAPIWSRGRKFDPASIRENQIYDFVYDASASGWHVLNPSPAYYLGTGLAKVYDSGGVVAGRASTSTSYIFGRNGNQIVFSLLASVSVSCSISGQSLVFSADGVTSIVSGAATKHSIPITVKDVVSQSWAANVVTGQVRAQASFNTAGTTVSAACTIRAAPFTALFISQTP